MHLSQIIWLCCLLPASCLAENQASVLEKDGYPVVIVRSSDNTSSYAEVTDLPDDATDSETTLSPVVYTTAQKYGYATAAVTVITALAFVGILAIPALGTRFYTIFMQSFIALGIGSLTGDALFHLIPYGVGVGDTHGAEETHVEDENDYLWKMCACIGGIWIMFLFEKCMKMFGAGHSHDHHLHNHNDHQTSVASETVVTSFSAPEEKANGVEVIQNHHAELEVDPPKDLEQQVEEKQQDEEKQSEDKSKENPKLLGIPIIGVMIFIGDALHNFGDGLALGVAFSESWVTGVGTSLAIFCHELPHEFSDFALYLNSGISKVKALLLNFAAACCCYIGLYIGLAISNDEEIRKWLLSFIAGIFLYIAFVDVFPEMWNEDKKRPYTTFFVQNIGMLIGWALLLLIAVYEEDLENSIG